MSLALCFILRAQSFDLANLLLFLSENFIRSVINHMILFVDDQKQNKHEVPASDWEQTGEPDTMQATRGKEISKDSVFDFDAFSDMLAEEELQTAMEQHRAKQAKIEQQRQKEQRDIDELRAFSTKETTRHEEANTDNEDNANNAAKVANAANTSNNAEATLLTDALVNIPSLAPREDDQADLQLAEEQLAKMRTEGHPSARVKPQQSVQDDEEDQLPIHTSMPESLPIHTAEEIADRSDEAEEANTDTEDNPPPPYVEDAAQKHSANAKDTDNPEDSDDAGATLESFTSEDTGEQQIDVESLSPRRLALTINDDSLYSVYAVKQLSQHVHLRAAIRNIRVKREDNLDFDRLAQIVEAQTAPSEEDGRHLQAFEMALQKFLTNLFDYIYVIGEIGGEISHLVSIEYEDFFESMTGLTRQEFTQLCEIGVFNGQELMKLITTFNSWCTKTMNTESYILYHTNALQGAG